MAVAAGEVRRPEVWEESPGKGTGDPPPYSVHFYTQVSGRLPQETAPARDDYAEAVRALVVTCRWGDRHVYQTRKPEACSAPAPSGFVFRGSRRGQGLRRLKLTSGDPGVGAR